MVTGITLALTKAAYGYRIADGFNPRAVIIPTKPAKHNGYCRWQVDAIGLNKPVPAKTLPQAKMVAYHYATA